MLIGIDTSTLGNKSTGTNRYVQCLLEQLYKFPINLKEFTYHNYSFSSENFLSKNLRILFRGGLQRHYFRIFQLSGKMNSAGVDAAIFPNYFMPPGFEKPSAVIIHDLSFITHPNLYSKLFVKYYNYSLKQTLSKNPLIVTISEFTKSQISKYLNISKDRIFLLQGYSKFNGLQINPNTSNGHKPYFLFVGHIEPRKNLNFLIDNFLKWKHSRGVPYKLKVAGDLWIKSKEIQELFNIYSGHEDIEFTGYVSEDELNALYNNASAFVHTSFVEGFGFPLLEAMNKGIPVLCSNNSATAEISKRYSVKVNPYSDKSLISGFDRLNNRIDICPRWKYKIDYSPGLMNSQLEKVINILESKVNLTFPVKLNNNISTEEALEKTLLYANLFNSGVRKKELHKFLFEKKTIENDLDDALEKLAAQNKIYFRDDRVYLKNGKISFYENKNDNISKKKIKKLLNFLKRIPFISNASFSGGTANYGIENHDDIDLFIITKPYTVYLVYVMIHLYSLLTKSRSYFCANFLIDEKEISINYQYDFYTAHQIISLVPVKNEKMLHFFFHANKWVKDFFPNFVINNGFKKPDSKMFVVFKPVNKLLHFFYKRLYKDSLKKSANNSLKLTENIIKLHTVDHRIKILNRFEKEWNEYKIRNGNKIITNNPVKKNRIKIYGN